MRKAKNINSDYIKTIEADVEKYRKKRDERIKLGKIQTMENTGQAWNTEYYNSDNN